MLAEDVQAAVQMVIRYPESRECLFLLNPLLYPDYIPFMTLQIYAEVNSFKLFRTLNLRQVSLLKCLQSNLSLSGTACLFFEGNHIQYLAISRQHSGWEANGGAASDIWLANLKISGEYCMSIQTDVTAQ